MGVEAQGKGVIQMPGDEKVPAYILHPVGRCYYIEHPGLNRFWKAKYASDAETFEFIEKVFEGKLVRGDEGG